VEPSSGVTCRVCFAHDCYHHGEIREPEHSDDDDAFDADHPAPINSRKRVTLEDPVPAYEDIGREPFSRPADIKSKQKKSVLEWWFENTLTWDHAHRGPFYPCSHPGKSCDQAHCRCYKDQITCEKACSCPPSCQRRHRGCSCKKGGKKRCLQDDRCECFRLNRECDVDLCGTCGVDLVLDRDIEDKKDVFKTCCRNASMQLGIPKQTSLATSKVHGFGLFAFEDIKKDDFVGEYVGEIIGQQETERRGAIYSVQKLSYLFALNRDQEIDSQRMGNRIRFINHAGLYSKSRNVYPKIMLCNMAHRIGMYALKDVAKGSELFFDYGKDYHQDLVGSNPNFNEDVEEVIPKTKNRALVETFIDPADCGDDENDEDYEPTGNRTASKAPKAEKGRRNSTSIEEPPTTAGVPKVATAVSINASRKSDKSSVRRVIRSSKTVSGATDNTGTTTAANSEQARPASKKSAPTQHDGRSTTKRVEPLQSIPGRANLDSDSGPARGESLQGTRKPRIPGHDSDPNGDEIDELVLSPPYTKTSRRQSSKSKKSSNDESDYDDADEEIADSEEDQDSRRRRDDDYGDDDDDDDGDESDERPIQKRTRRSLRSRATKGE